MLEASAAVDVPEAKLDGDEEEEAEEVGTKLPPHRL